MKRNKEETKTRLVRADDPFLSARLEYSDRYGSAIKDVRRWRRFAFAMLLGILAMGALMMWLASQNKVVPYVVQLDKQGYTVAIKPAEKSAPVEQKVIIATLGRFFINLKTRFNDNFAQKQLIDEVYNYIASESAAFSYVNEFYKKHNPFANGPTDTRAVEVELISVTPLTSNDNGSWQVRWREHEKRGGSTVRVTSWRAIVQYATSAVALDEASLIKNPLGIFVTSISMSQDMSE